MLKVLRSDVVPLIHLKLSSDGGVIGVELHSTRQLEGSGTNGKLVVQEKARTMRLELETELICTEVS